MANPAGLSMIPPSKGMFICDVVLPHPQESGAKGLLVLNPGQARRESANYQPTYLCVQGMARGNPDSFATEVRDALGRAKRHYRSNLHALQLYFTLLGYVADVRNF